MARRRGEGHGHHGGAWKVAYADFVTAMMAFFIVMWVLGMDQKTKEAVFAYFANPSAPLSTTIGAGGTPIGADAGGGEAMTVLPIPMAAKDSRLGILQSSLNSELERLPEFRDLADSIEIRVDAEGLHIELLEREDDTFFDSGSAELTERGAELLQVIGRVLARFPNQIALEGHTDSTPYEAGGPGYTNWELSADRANAARRAISAVLPDPNQICEVRGFADRLPRTAVEPSDPTNRRVSILVKPMATTDAAPVRAAAPEVPALPTADQILGIERGDESGESAEGEPTEVVPQTHVTPTE